MKRKAPSPAIPIDSAYRVPRASAPIDLWLDANEGATPRAEWLKLENPDQIRRYPNRHPLQARLAGITGARAEEIIVSNGGDDVIDRICRAYLGKGRNLVVTSPSFVMIGRYAGLTGAEVRTCEWWAGAYPLTDVEALVDQNTGVIAVVSPNNPTGEVVAASTIRGLAEKYPETLILADLAYVEFAAHDPSMELLEEPNIVLIRTLSKAYGLAGLRVGYGMGHPDVVAALNAVGGPYPVSAASLQIAEQAIDQGQKVREDYLGQVVSERSRLHELLDELEIEHTNSEGNFVFARVGDGGWFRDALSGLGIGVRAWPDSPSLKTWVRVSCPGDEASFERLTGAIRAALAPEAMIFDLDGVVVDVRDSYRRAIIDTAAHFGLEVGVKDIAALKAKGNANNDWRVTHRLLKNAGIDVSLEAVTADFESRYQGSGDVDGLWRKEKALVTKPWFEAVQASGQKLGVVTGRPRRDAARLLDFYGLTELFEAVICMEDATLKPDPAPVRLALNLLGVESAWMFGDTPDDMIAARGAGVIPVGVMAPGDDTSEVLHAAGAGWVMERMDDLDLNRLKRERTR